MPATKRNVLHIFVGAVLLALTGCGDQVLPVDDNTDPTKQYDIVYNQITGNDFTGIGTVRQDGTNPTSITTRGDFGMTAPPSSNSYIAMIGPDEEFIHIIDIRSGNIVKQVARRYGKEINFNSASISPDGSKVAYSVDYDDAQYESGTLVKHETKRVVIADINSNNYVLLDAGARHESYIRFSPDGKYVAFFGLDTAKEGGSGWLYVANVDGSELRKAAIVQSIPHDGQMLFSWSPDGKQIVYTDWQDGIMYVAAANGSGTNALLPGYAANWSADGARIVFVDPENNTAKIVNSNGSGTVESLSVTALWPEWSPDNRYILLFEFDSNLSMNDQMPVMSVLNVETKQRTELAADGAMGFWIK